MHPQNAHMQQLGSVTEPKTTLQTKSISDLPPRIYSLYLNLNKYIEICIQTLSHPYEVAQGCPAGLTVDESASGDPAGALEPDGRVALDPTHGTVHIIIGMHRLRIYSERSMIHKC